MYTMEDIEAVDMDCIGRVLRAILPELFFIWYRTV